MRLPRVSGKRVIKALERAGFSVARQKGSHVIMIRNINGRKHGVVVPKHKELDIGTLAEIIRQSKLGKKKFVKLLG
ncbi:addiction module toxin, HicA family [Candidatus Woesearchaeota archaeon]|nr:addiction module toxin, HicA family [Candidatus Woesearchaeota archaeon]